MTECTGSITCSAIKRRTLQGCIGKSISFISVFLKKCSRSTQTLGEVQKNRDSNCPGIHPMYHTFATLQQPKTERGRWTTKMSMFNLVLRGGEGGERDSNQ